MVQIPAFVWYQRRASPIPSEEAHPDVRALSVHVNRELGAIQNAIPVATTGTITTDYAIQLSDNVLLVDCTAGAVQVTFPDPTRSAHGQWTVKKIDASGNHVNMAATVLSTNTAATFDGSTTPSLTTQYAKVTYRSDGAAYYSV